MTAPANRLRAYLREDERGAITYLMLVLFIGILVLTGVALDLAKHESQRADLQSAVDRGTLAAASLRQRLKNDDPDTEEVEADNLTEMIKSYVAARSLSTEGTTVQVQDNSTLNARDIAVQADYDMPTDFFRLVGVSRLDVEAGSRAVQRATNVEISMILDISGSMRFTGFGVPKITALIPAAKQFVDIVTANGNAKNTTINLIRYAGQTNPGEWMFRRLGGVSCSSARAATRSSDPSDANYDPSCNPDIVDPGFDLSSDDPDDSDEKPPIPLWAHEKSHCMYMNPGADFFDDDLPNMPASGWDGGAAPVESRDQVIHFHKWAMSWNWMKWGWCPSDHMATVYMANGQDVGTGIDNDGPDTDLLPDTDDGVVDYDDLIDGIDAIARDPGTDGNLHDGTGTYNAMKWGVALLNPTTRPIIAEMAAAGLVDSAYVNRPADWTDPDTQKYIVLMTDGLVTQQYDVRNKNDPDNIIDVMTEADGHETDRGGGEGATQLFNAGTGVNYLLEQCRLAKQNGVTIFTIAFLVDDGEMVSCASSPSHAYRADTLNIGSTFRQIATTIQKLRLVM